MRRAQQLLYLSGLEWGRVGLDLGHRVAQLFGAHGPLVSADPPDRLLQQAERVAERESALALDRRGGGGGLHRRRAFLAAPSAPTPAATATAFPFARPLDDGRAGAQRRLRQRADHLRAERDFVLAVVEPG